MATKKQTAAVPVVDHPGEPPATPPRVPRQAVNYWCNMDGAVEGCDRHGRTWLGANETPAQAVKRVAGTKCQNDNGRCGGTFGFEVVELHI